MITLNTKMSVLGIDMGASNIQIGLVNKDQITCFHSMDIDSLETKKQLLNELFRLIETIKLNKFDAIGIGVPSIVDTEKGILYDTTNIPSWKKVEIESILEDRYHVPVYVNNDANCFVLGEKYYGKGQGFHSIVGLTIGTGLGAGIIIRDKLYMGKNCGAGEIGMIPFQKHNYEYYCSSQFFIKENGTSPEQAYMSAKKGNRADLSLFNHFGKNLGYAIRAVLCAYDPDITILGGSIRKAYPFFQREMWKTIKKFEFKYILKNLKIEISDLPNAGVMGAAALVYESQRNTE